MQLRPLIIVVAAAFIAACSSTPDEPGLFARTWESTQRLNPLSRELKPREMKTVPPPNLKPIATSLAVEPPEPKLAEVRLLKVTLQLINRGKRGVRLDFPGTQRVDVIIKDKTGRIIERWSEDRRFENQPGVVTINPGERLEYIASVATREMKAGETYTIEAWLPAYDSLRANGAVTPVK